ncbi:MAG: hypothetical protein IJY89_05765, partial [Clostridia bacterium]|nr:hypothetical protein [Clostridia bacterium]
VKDVEKEQARALLEKSDTYKALYEGLLAREDKIGLRVVEKCTYAELNEIFQDVIYSSPELFYVKGYRCATYYDEELGEDVVAEVYPVYYSYDGQTLDEVIAEYNALMEELYALGSMEWSDLETALFYHDYLTAYYEYDLDYTIYDAYGFLKNKEGVCQAYMLVFKGLMDHFDVVSTYAQSTNINHIWNVVFIDGEWCHIDATWDDPISDRPGRAQHAYFLIGAEQNEELHFTQKGVANDMILGSDVPVSKDDHVYTSVWKGTDVPFVEASGNFYGVVVTEEKTTDQMGEEIVTTTVKFAEIHFEKGGQVTGYETLPIRWASMCTDGRYVYYSNGWHIYRYDPEGGQKTTVKEYNDGKMLWGLRFENEKLMAYRGNTPSDAIKEEASVRLPVYHTITWIIDGEKYFSVAEEGEIPEFDGSTWKENEGGFSYAFIGWTPEPSEAYCEMTYVAIYAVVPEFVLGDVSGDGEVTIADVAGLLDYLADPENAAVNLSALDTNGDGLVTIADVATLLDYLAGNDVTLN